MIKLNYLNKSFNTHKDVFKFLKENKEEIISCKKVYKSFSDPISYNIIEKSLSEKGLTPKEEIMYGSCVYPVINTTNYMDNHDDVHITGLWNKSVNEQQGKVYFVADHKLEVDKIISRPKEVEMMLKQFQWSELGLPYQGMTEALIFKAKLTERSMKAAYESLKAGDPMQYSVRMVYVKILMAINDTDSEYKDEFINWQKYYPLIANKERPDERGFFFPVIEAKIFKEGSMVIAGSNDATMTMYDLEEMPMYNREQKTQPDDTTGQHTEPPTSTQKGIDYKYLINNLKLR